MSESSVVPSKTGLPGPPPRRTTLAPAYLREFTFPMVVVAVAAVLIAVPTLINQRSTNAALDSLHSEGRVATAEVIDRSFERAPMGRSTTLVVAYQFEADGTTWQYETDGYHPPGVQTIPMRGETFSVLYLPASPDTHVFVEAGSDGLFVHERSLEISGNWYGTPLFFAAVFAAITAALLLAIWLFLMVPDTARILRTRRLARKGTAARAQVTSVKSDPSHPRLHHILYRYESGSGREHTGKTLANEKELQEEAIREGGALAIFFDPARPDRHVPLRDLGWVQLTGEPAARSAP